MFRVLGEMVCLVSLGGVGLWILDRKLLRPRRRIKHAQELLEENTYLDQIINPPSKETQK